MKSVMLIRMSSGLSKYDFKVVIIVRVCLP